MLKKGITALLVIVCIAALMAACGGGTKGSQAGDNDSKRGDRIDQLSTTEPITLKVWTGANDNIWINTIEEPIKKKFPNVTLERVSLQQNSLQKLLSAGDPPDIIHGSKNHMVFQVMPAKMEYDLRELIKKYNYDLNRYLPELIDSMKNFGDNGQIYGLPNTKVVYGLLYNKRLFEKFAVPFPKDGMTWDEAIQLARRMTRVEDGIQYRGLDIQFYNIIGSQLNLEVIDRNGKANMSNWLKAATVFKQIYDIPGNNGPIAGTIAKTMDPFYKETLAMVAINPDTMFSSAKQYPDLQWDLVSVPTFPEAPNVDPYMNYTFFAVSPTSKYKEDAFKVIVHLNSDEVQTASIRKGFPTVLKNPEIQKQYTADLPELRDKNVQAVFRNKQSDPYVSPYFDSSIDTLVKNGFNDIRQNKGDINTILRRLDEEINKKVAEMKFGS
jgi:multiple sugar transport system substrate-binding protein